MKRSDFCCEFGLYLIAVKTPYSLVQKTGDYMSTVKIGSDERPLGEADAQWINQQINRRRDDGEDVCVIVRINEPGVDVTLATPSCGGGGGGGRKANDQESAVLSLWTDRGMNQTDFNGGSLVAFLSQLDRLL
ncbi:hypothetical protein MYE70_00010 [Marinobacter alexandrii]|uniref:hypothetical protein n=1 Tax=Marinobacter alexandrii TaxID=2570351 RepID=UPI0011086068|nr:hypothetical protein [Marinobacter alexandrii]MCK2147443.1 hypothetical protein [Marinobacter alexandrii]